MMDDIPSRLAVLEQIARSTDAALGRIDADIREIRGEMKSQFRWLLGTILLVLLSQAALWLRVGAISAQHRAHHRPGEEAMTAAICSATVLTGSNGRPTSGSLPRGRIGQ